MCLGQGMFSKTYDLGFGNDNLLWSFTLHDDTIIAATGDICFSTSQPCSTVSKYGMDGELLNLVNAEDFKFGNEDVFSILGDSLFMSGQSILPPKLTAQFLRTSPALDNYKKTQLIPDDRYTYFNEGLLFHEGSFYSYGNGGIIENDSIIGYVTKWQEDLMTVDTVYIFQQFDLENMVDDLQVDFDGNLVFLNRGQDSSEIGFQGSIVTINTSGEILDEMNFKYEGTADILPNFVLNQDGNYIIPDRGEFPLFTRERILCFDKLTKELKWETYLPFDGFEDNRSYYIIDLNRTVNGDILISGDVANGDGLNFNKSGFITRINGFTGEIVWNRIYKDWNNVNGSTQGYIDESFINQVMELDNGDILAGGRIREKGNPQLNLLWLLRLNENGCLHSEDCEEENFTSDIIDLVIEEKSIIILPNPVQNTLYLSSDLPLSHYSISSLSGSVLQSRSFESTIDVSSLVPGLYFITVWDDEGNSATERFVKVDR